MLKNTNLLSNYLVKIAVILLTFISIFNIKVYADEYFHVFDENTPILSAEDEERTFKYEGNYYFADLEGDVLNFIETTSVTAYENGDWIYVFHGFTFYKNEGDGWYIYNYSDSGNGGQERPPLGYTNIPIHDKSSEPFVNSPIVLEKLKEYGFPTDKDYLPVESGYSKEQIKNFEFGQNEAHFYTPSNNSTLNFHYKDQYFYKFNARLYVRSYGDIFISDKKIMEMLLSTLKISSPFKLYDCVGTYVVRPSITNNFESKFYIDLVLGFPSTSKIGNYTLTASFPGSGTSQNEDIKSASVLVNITNDGSKQEGVFDEDGSIELPSNGSSIGGGSSINGDDFPIAPGKDGSIGDWFDYIGSLIMWIITYPFKLLGDVFNVLTNYINVMVNQLTETSRAITGLFTFIPQDILNVTFGVISFTLLYSVVRGVLKLIRG